MHDEVLVREVDGAEDDAKKLDALADGELARGAVLVDGLAFDVLGDEVGNAVIGLAGVEQLDDGGVIEDGEGLALVLEAAEDVVVKETGANELEGDTLAEFAIGALGEVDGAHAAAADLAKDLVGADAAAEHGVGGERGRVEEAAGWVVIFEEGRDFAVKVVIAGAGLGEEGRALIGRAIEGFGEEALGARVEGFVRAMWSHRRHLGSAYRAAARLWRGSIRA